MKVEANKHIIRNLIIFVFCIIAIPWLGWWLDVQRGFDPHTQDGSLGWLFFILTPLATTLLLRSFAGDGWQDFGLKPTLKSNGKWYLFGVLFHPLSIVLILAIGWVTGATLVLDASAGKLGLVGKVMLLGILPSLVKNIFEEFAWRGYLTPKVQSIIENPLIGHAVVGIIWLSWHLPYYLVLMSPDVMQTATGLGLGVFLLMGLIGIIPTAILYGELRLWTDSVWPAVIIHVSANVFFDSLILQKFFSFSSKSAELFFAPGLYGVLVIGVNLTVGLWLFRQRMKKQMQGVSAHA